MHRFILCIGLSLVAAAGYAQDGFPISADRPSFSDGTEIIPKGRWQIEGGYTYTKAGGAEFHSIGELLFRFPLSERLEFRILNLDFTRANTAGGGGTGWLDPSLGVKYLFRNGVTGRSPDVALVAQTSLPVGSEAFRVRRSQPSVRIVGSEQLNPVDNLGAEIGYSSLGPKGAAFDQWALSGCWSRAFNAKAGGFAEMYYLSAMSPCGPSATFADTGVTFLLDKATQLDFRIGSGLNERRDGWFVGAGLSFRM